MGQKKIQKGLLDALDSYQKLEEKKMPLRFLGNNSEKILK